MQGFIGRTETPGRDGHDHAMSLSGTYESQMWRISTGYQDNGEDFNPEVGYLHRPGGFRKYDLAINNRSRPEGFLRFQELRPHVTLHPVLEPQRGSWRRPLFTTTSWASSRTARRSASPTNMRSETVFDAFSVSGLAIPPGRYDWSEIIPSFFYNRSAPVSAGVRATFGGFFGGRIVTLRPTICARHGDALNLELSYSRNDIDLPSGKTTTKPDRRARRLQLLAAACSSRRCCSTTTAPSSGR